VLGHRLPRRGAKESGPSQMSCFSRDEDLVRETEAAPVAKAVLAVGSG